MLGAPFEDQFLHALSSLEPNEPSTLRQPKPPSAPQEHSDPFLARESQKRCLYLTIPAGFSRFCLQVYRHSLPLPSLGAQGPSATYDVLRQNQFTTTRSPVMGAN